jgi:hypothetical protein
LPLPRRHRRGFRGWPHLLDQHGIPNLDDGSIERANLDGKNRKVIIPKGVTYTPKQLHLDKDGCKLYWRDRERDELLIGLLQLRTKRPETSALREVAAE